MVVNEGCPRKLTPSLQLTRMTGALSCVLIFLNFSDVSRMFSFLLLYYYLCILDVMIRLPLVLV